MSNDKINRIASIMAARYVNVSHNACINDWDSDPSWVIDECVSIIDKEVSGFRAEFHVQRRKYQNIIQGFTPEMMEQARQMFAPKQ